MVKLFRAIGMLLVVVWLAGCANPASIKPHATSADELLKSLGQPTDKRRGPDGGEFWEYAYGPEGTETWLYEIDLARMVRSATQLLTEERLRRVVPGVTTDVQVRELLGKPRDITRFGDETAWEWRVKLTPNLGLFIARFGPDGRAVGVDVLVDVSPDSDMKEN